MTLLDAYAACPHGGAIVRPGSRIERWMTEKPGMAPAPMRFLAANIDSLTSDELGAADWELEA